MTFQKPDWWNTTEDSSYKSSQKTRQESPRAKTPQSVKISDKQEFSEVVNGLLTTIESQKQEIEHYTRLYKNEQETTRYLNERILELEISNNKLLEVVRSIGNKDFVFTTTNTGFQTLNTEINSTILDHLFISEDAPKELFDAVYRAAIKMHHPDVGGNEETMKQINMIKDETYGKHGWK